MLLVWASMGSLRVTEKIPGCNHFSSNDNDDDAPSDPSLQPSSTSPVTQSAISQKLGSAYTLCRNACTHLIRGHSERTADDFCPKTPIHRLPLICSFLSGRLSLKHQPPYPKNHQMSFPHGPSAVDTRQHFNLFDFKV